MTKMSDLHDLVIRQITLFLYGDDVTLINLMRVSKRFYGLRDIFFNGLELSTPSSHYALQNKPYGWNKVLELSLHGIKFTDNEALKLSLHGDKFTDISLLRGMHSLIFSDCDFICDLAPLTNSHSLDFEACSFRDLDEMENWGSVQDIGFYYCDDLCDTSSLSDIHTVEIMDCRFVQDVSALGGVYELFLTELDINDVTDLGHVHTLIIDGCSQVRDLSPLKNVHNLTLANLHNITDVSVLGMGKVHTLTLMYMNNITDVSALEGVTKLTVKQCKKILDS